MTLSEKKDLYIQKFPKILAERMCEQMFNDESNIDERHPLTWLIISFGTWHLTKEGDDFWYDIHLLYNGESTPTTLQIQVVFKRHRIEYNVV